MLLTELKKEFIMLFTWFYRLLHTNAFLALLNICSATCIPILAEATPMPNVFINEIHYDNIGGDVGEYVEIAGDSSISLTGWSVRLYTGSNGKEYDSFSFDSWSYIDTSTRVGFHKIETVGLQNGGEDGIVLFDGTDIIQFLSYEGNLTATDGIAIGLTSTNIGVSESNSTPVGYSLQLTGKGNRYSDFTWSSPQANTFGAMNSGQQFPIPVSEPDSFSLFLILLLFLYFQRGNSFEIPLSFSKKIVRKAAKSIVENSPLHPQYNSSIISQIL